MTHKSEKKKKYSAPKIRTETILEAGLVPVCNGMENPNPNSDNSNANDNPGYDYGHRKSVDPCVTLKT